MLTIIGPDEVTLMSLEADDAPLLVVGNPPVSAPLVLVGHGDIKLELATDEHGKGIQVASGTDFPMIVAPVRQPEMKRSRER